MSMTWDEFKKHVDQRLKDQALDGTIQVHYIGVSYPAVKKIGESHGGLSCPSVEADNEGVAIFN